MNVFLEFLPIASYMALEWHEMKSRWRCNVDARALVCVLVAFCGYQTVVGIIFTGTKVLVIVRKMRSVSMWYFGLAAIYMEINRKLHSVHFSFWGHSIPFHSIWKRKRYEFKANEIRDSTIFKNMILAPLRGSAIHAHCTACTCTVFTFRMYPSIHPFSLVAVAWLFLGEM